MYENAHTQTLVVDFSRRLEQELFNSRKMYWTIKGEDKAISSSVVIEAALRQVACSNKELRL